jgi:hypothetical protein
MIKSDTSVTQNHDCQAVLKLVSRFLGCRGSKNLAFLLISTSIQCRSINKKQISLPKPSIDVGWKCMIYAGI